MCGYLTFVWIDERNKSLTKNIGAGLKLDRVDWSVVVFLFADDSVLFAGRGLRETSEGGGPISLQIK